MATEKRERWSSRTAFIMAAIGSAVGLGNLWRFPAVAFKSGGGAFFIPYFVALITAGIPLMIVEYAIGQKFQCGAPHALAAVTKRFRWVGWFALLIASVICMYYVVVMAYAWHYCAGSFSLAWTKPVGFVELQRADDGAPTVTRVPSGRVKLYVRAPDEEAKLRLEQAQSHRADRLPVFAPADLEKAEQQAQQGDTRYVSLEENVGHYFEERCLGGFHAGVWSLKGEARDARVQLEQAAPPGVEPAREGAAELEAALAPYENELFKLSLNLVLGAALTWLLIFLIIFKGVRNVGRVVMFTVPLPVILLLVILVRGLTLPGATTGILYYLTPNWEMLKDPNVWMRAYGQIFFSLTLGFGVLIAYASYMPRDSDVTGNAFITSFANCATSFVAGLAVFSVLGYLAHVNSAQVQDVVKGGPGLVFVTYPIALAKMPMAPWAIAALSFVFFVCLISLGIDSAFSLVEGLVAGFRDSAPRLSKPLLTALFCVIGFCGSLFICTRSGLMWLDILDNWTNNYGLALVGLLECVAVGYFFRLDELKDYINEHSEIKVHYWFDACVKFITPATLTFLLGRQFLGDISETYGGYDKIVAHSVTFAGWGMFVAVFMIALVMGRNWRTLAWMVAILVVTGLLYGYFEWQAGDVTTSQKLAAAIMGAVGAVLLFGGLIGGILTARKHGRLARLAEGGMMPTEGEEDMTSDEPTESEYETHL